MNNPATRHRDELNDFTTFIKENPGTKVRLRNGLVVQPVFMPENEYEGNEDMFQVKDTSLYTIWNLDGTNIQRNALDMMKILEGE